MTVIAARPAAGEYGRGPALSPAALPVLLHCCRMRAVTLELAVSDPCSSAGAATPCLRDGRRRGDALLPRRHAEQHCIGHDRPRRRPGRLGVSLESVAETLLQGPQERLLDDG